MKLFKGLSLGLCLCLALFLCGTIEAQSSKPGSSSSSKPSSPKFSAPPSKPAVTPSKPKFSAPTTPSVPKTDGNKDKDGGKPKFSSPGSTGSNHDSHVGKPSNKDGSSQKAQAAKEARSEAKWKETQKAQAPPVAKYTSPEGKTVNVRTGSKDVEYIRSLPSSSIKPEVRQQNITVHVTKHYHHPYTYYTSQPVVYVGGGYSSAFWWMMMEWDAERRARWLYHNRYNIEADAYSRGMRDAQVSQYIAKLEADRAYRDANYVDSEFSKDRSLMYTDDYVRAAYNPTVHHDPTPVSGSAVLKVFLVLASIVLGGVILWVIYYLIFVARWGR